jgi:hypothetical protein
VPRGHNNIEEQLKICCSVEFEQNKYVQMVSPTRRHGNERETNDLFYRETEHSGADGIVRLGRLCGNDVVSSAALTVALKGRPSIIMLPLLLSG